MDQKAATPAVMATILGMSIDQDSLQRYREGPDSPFAALWDDDGDMFVLPRQ